MFNYEWIVDSLKRKGKSHFVYKEGLPKEPIPECTPEDPVLLTAAKIIEDYEQVIPHICRCCVGCELEKSTDYDNCSAFIMSHKRAIQFVKEAVALKYNLEHYCCCPSTEKESE